MKMTCMEMNKERKNKVSFKIKMIWKKFSLMIQMSQTNHNRVKMIWMIMEMSSKNSNSKKHLNCPRLCKNRTQISFMMTKMMIVKMVK